MGWPDSRTEDVVAIGGPRGIPHHATWVQRTWGLHLESRRPKGSADSCAMALLDGFYSAEE